MENDNSKIKTTTLDYDKLICLVCDKELDPVAVNPLASSWIPSNGVLVEIQGNYGSTVFDPMHRQGQLLAVICDECFKDKLVSHMRIVSEKITRSISIHRPEDLEDLDRYIS